MTTTPTLTLTDFLATRLDAEADAAQAALNNQRVTWASTADSAASLAGADAGLFILFNDPARVLREVEAKRAILAAHEILGDDTGRGCVLCNWREDFGWREQGPCDTLRALASVYRDHEAYDGRWAG